MHGGGLGSDGPARLITTYSVILFYFLSKVFESKFQHLTNA